MSNFKVGKREGNPTMASVVCVYGGAVRGARTPKGICGVNSEGAAPSPEVRSLAMYTVVVERVWVRVCAVRRWSWRVVRLRRECVSCGEKNAFSYPTVLK